MAHSKKFTKKDLITEDILMGIFMIILLPFAIWQKLFGEEPSPGELIEREKREKLREKESNMRWGYYSHKLYGKEFSELTKKQRDEVVIATLNDPNLAPFIGPDPFFLA